MNDGEYNIEVSLHGGSGKASVTSPTKLIVADGKMQAEIEWSSSHYDYMEVDGKEYYPINDEGNSLFLIDVPELDTDIPIEAETLAMSEPHTIEYTLHFDSSTASVRKSDNSNMFIILGAICGVFAVTAVMAALLRKKKSNVKS